MILRSLTFGAEVFLAAALASQFAARQTQSCDHSLKPVAGVLGYRPRSGRCEGLYEAPSGNYFELVSIVREDDAETPPSDSIRLLLGDSFPARGLRLRVAAIDENVHYRLDARANAQRFAWSVRDVLVPARLDARRLGFLASYESPSGDVFVPVTLMTGDTSGQRGTVLIVRSALDLERVFWRAYPAKGGGAAAASASFRLLAGAPLDAGAPIRLSLPNNLRGLVVVDIRGKAVNRDRHESLRILIQI